MSIAAGSKARVIYIKESTWGTTPVGSTLWKGCRLVGDSLQANINNFESNELRSDRTVMFQRPGNKAAGGEIRSELSAEGFSQFWLDLLAHQYVRGTDTVGGNPYTHTLKAGSYQNVGFSIEKGFTDINQYFVYTGCRMNTLSINCPQEGIVTANWGVLCKQETDPTGSSQDSTVTFPTGDPFVGFECAIVEGGAVTLAIAQSATIQINNGYRDNVYVLGSDVRKDLPPGKRHCSGSLVLYFEDATMYNKFKQQTDTSLKFTFTNSASNTLEIYFPKVRYGGGSPTPVLNDDGPIQATFPWRAMYDTSEQTDVRVKITNTEADLDYAG